MRIATITNWAYGATVCLTLAAGVTMVMASNADREERAAVIQREQFDQLTFEIENDLDQLTDQARLAAMSDDPSHVIAFQHMLDSLHSAEQRVEALRDVGASREELRSLADGLRWARTLEDTQKAAVAASQRGDRAQAQKIVFGPEFQRELERVHFQIGRFRYLLDTRSDQAIARAADASQRLRLVSEVTVAITAILFLFVLGFILKRRIIKPVVRLSDVIGRLAEQDYAVDPPILSQVDEIGDMAQAIRVFRENGLERQKLERERDADRQVRDMLARMTQRLQGCETMDDLCDVVKLFAPRIAPTLAGRLHIFDAAKGRLACRAEWLGPQAGAATFAPDDCWALRRGQVHMPGSSQMDVPCKHVAAAGIEATMCVPLAAQGETMGLLALESRNGHDDADPALDVYIELMSETIGLALANLGLREAMQEKALTDPLTGLRNRHELDGALRRMTAEADAAGSTVAALMLDIDHFKRLNDGFGHDAGDMVIRAVADAVAAAGGADSFACRYGGEEFLLLLPGHAEPRALLVADTIESLVRDLYLAHGGLPVGPITVSMGVAIYPDHGPAQSLIATADAAMYRAKEQGRNRTVVAVTRKLRSVEAV